MRPPQWVVVQRVGKYRLGSLLSDPCIVSIELVRIADIRFAGTDCQTHALLLLMLLHLMP